MRTRLHRTCVILASIGCLSVPSAALEWSVDAYLWALERPTGPDGSQLDVSATHYLTVESFTRLDALTFPQARIVEGELRQDGGISADRCSTSYQLIDERKIHSCTTGTLRDPCFDSTWEATTTGSVIGSLDHGERSVTAAPQKIFCCD